MRTAFVVMADIVVAYIVVNVCVHTLGMHTWLCTYPHRQEIMDTQEVIATHRNEPVRVAADVHTHVEQHVYTHVDSTCLHTYLHTYEIQKGGACGMELRTAHGVAGGAAEFEDVDGRGLAHERVGDGQEHLIAQRKVDVVDGGLWPQLMKPKE